MSEDAKYWLRIVCIAVAVLLAILLFMHGLNRPFNPRWDGAVS